MEAGLSILVGGTVASGNALAHGSNLAEDMGGIYRRLQRLNNVVLNKKTPAFWQEFFVRLFGAKGHNRVFLCGVARGDQAGNEGQEYGDTNQNQSGKGIQIGTGAQVCHVMQ